MVNTPPKISVIVISMGRPECLDEIAKTLNDQTRRPDRILFVVTDRSDVSPELHADRLQDIDVKPEIFITSKGTCHQRNVGLDQIDHIAGYVAFLDDDYVPAPDALEAIETAFQTFGDDIGGMSGALLADGIVGPGIDTARAQKLIAEHQRGKSSDFLSNREFSIKKDTIGLYGCNMVLRVEAVGPTRFDENLPLYAWQEDVDFAHRVALRSGKRMILTDAFAGVHRGVKNGREQRGIRLGYSQVANNWYLWRNSQLPAKFAARVALRNILANHAKIFHSENWVDRSGRAKGNRLAIWDVLCGRCDPHRILEI